MSLWLWTLGAAWAGEGALVLLQPEGALPGPLAEAVLLTLSDPPPALRDYDVATLRALGATAQLDAVRPLLAEPEVLAAAWVDPSDPAVVRLVVVFATEGRGVVRVVEEPAGPGAEQAVALALRELVAAAQVPEPEPDPEPAPIAPVDPVPEVQGTLPRPKHVAVRLGGELGVGDVGPGAWGTLALRGGLQHGPGFGLTVEGALRHGGGDPVRVSGGGLALEAALSTGGERVSAHGGLRLGAVALRVVDGVTQDDPVWLPELTAGLAGGLRLQLGGTSIGAWAQGSGLVVSGEVLRRTDGSTALAAGPLQLAGGLELGWWL